MTDEPSESAATTVRPVIAAEALLAADLAKVLQHFDVIETDAHWDDLVSAAKAETRPDVSAALELLATVGRFAFSADDPGTPFKAMFVTIDRRSAIPQDFEGAQSEEFGKAAQGITHLGFRARLADVAWLLNRKRRDLAELAASSYVECAQLVVSGQCRHRFEAIPEPGFETIDLLRRAFHIHRAITPRAERETRSDIVDVVDALLTRGEQTKDENLYCRSIEAALDFSIGDPIELASRAERAVEEWNLRGHWAKHLLEQAVRGFRRSQRPDEVNRCQIAIAEQSVLVSQTNSESAMFQAHWLMTAIAELRLAGGERARKRAEELRVLLREVQENQVFEMKTFKSDTIDLTKIVEHYLQELEGMTFGHALGHMATLAVPRDPSVLQAEALKQLQSHFLSSLFGAAHMDGEGKVIARAAPSSPGTPSDDAVRGNIAQSLAIERQIAVVGMFEPLRDFLLAQISIAESDFLIITENSAFVPKGYEYVFALGFARLFQGDMVSAANVLLPMLENSIRYILKTSGTDSSKIESDLTQEDRSLSTLLEHERAALESILGAANVLQIDMLFSNRPGPALRHEQAHGKLTTGHCFSHDVRFACWYIFHLTCAPLQQHWPKIAAIIDERAQGRAQVLFRS